MKKIKFLAIALLSVGSMLLMAATLPDTYPQYYTLFNGKTFTKSATKTDTTGWIPIAGAEEIDVAAFYSGSASSSITIYAIGKYGSKSKLVWSGSQIVKPFDSTAGIYTARIRMVDSNKVGIPTHIKIATTVIGSSDSSNLLKYYGYMEAR